MAIQFIFFRIKTWTPSCFYKPHIYLQFQITFIPFLLVFSISFLSILSTSSEISIGHIFHLFKLIFSVVTSFVLLSKEKLSKNKKKKLKFSKKTTTAQKIEKNRGAKEKQYLEEHIEKAKRYFGTLIDFRWKNHEHRSCRTYQDLQVLFWSFLHPIKW